MEVINDLDLKIDAEFLRKSINHFSENLKRLETSTEYNSLFRTDDEEVFYKNNSGGFFEEYSESVYIQYAFTYHLRLVSIRKDLKEQAKSKWKAVKVCDNILDVKGKVKI